MNIESKECVDFLPMEFTIANHKFKVIQYDSLYDEHDTFLYGQFNYEDLEISVAIKNHEGNPLNKEIILNSYYHELFHLFNYLWNTETDESLAQTFANFIREYETTKIITVQMESTSCI